MTIDDETIAQNAASARERIVAIKELFDAIKSLLRAQIEAFPEVDGHSPKALITKLNELQSAQVLLLKAEDAYYEKYQKEEAEAAIDHDALRDKIRRTLAGIRDAKSARNFSERMRSGAD